MGLLLAVVVLAVAVRRSPLVLLLMLSPQYLAFRLHLPPPRSHNIPYLHDEPLHHTSTLKLTYQEKTVENSPVIVNQIKIIEYANKYARNEFAFVIRFVPTHKICRVADKKTIPPKSTFPRRMVWPRGSQ